MADLKRVYTAPTEDAALSELAIFEEKWSKKYPKIPVSWRNNWPKLATYFKYPQEVRTLIYITNSIEGFNRQLRKVTQSKIVFPTDDSLFKMLYPVNHEYQPKIDRTEKKLVSDSFPAANLFF